MSPIAFTVDRQGTLREGDIIEAKRHLDIQPSMLQELADSWFPDGVTSHGERYLLRLAPATLFDPSVELTCELIRRAEFPQLPSRFRSVFGWETLAEATLFLASFGINCDGAQIFEVESKFKPFRADMRCLDIRSSILVTAYGARRYWRQEPNDLGWFPGGNTATPLWELLLSPPVRVLRKLN